MIPAWNKRNRWIRQYIAEDKKIIDWGCGNKRIKKYIQCKDYLGIDKTDSADIITDFNLEVPYIIDHYDIGLVLGVLEYLDNPKLFLESINSTADLFLILVLSNKTKKKEWTNNFSQDNLLDLINPIWSDISFYYNGNYILALCKN